MELVNRTGTKSRKVKHVNCDHHRQSWLRTMGRVLVSALYRYRTKRTHLYIF